jgi:predicted esterase
VAAKAPAAAKGKAGPAQPYHLPPLGITLAPEIRQPLEQKLHALEAAVKPLAQDPLIADVSVLLKAVRYAFINSEIYVPKDVEKVRELLQLAETRLTELQERRAAWPKQTGTLARGFISGIDGTPQPIGLEIPPDLNFSKPVPLMVWLHGRGDKNTDLHFIADRLHKAGQFQPGGCIIVHPFGRQCLGYQLAGETDVLEAVEAVKRLYKIDDKRIMLGGFSMGGAGAWHIGAHYVDLWCALHTGAGFVDVKRFLKLTPETVPPAYTQTLWGQYDVPDYVRNLFNIPVLAYSGEVDGQKLAADIMAEAFQSEGRKLDHRIGPGMGHKYHTNVLKDILVWSHDRLQKGQPAYPKTVHWQGRTLKYSRMFWLTVTGLQKHWEDSRVDAEWEGNLLKVTTKNVSRFQVRRAPSSADWTLNINGNGLTLGSKSPANVTINQVLDLELKEGRWQPMLPSANTGLRKTPNLQGPIDDAFMSAFVVVPPDKLSTSAVREAFYKRELAYTIRRWREVFRGDLPIKRGAELTAEDLKTKNLIFFGEPENNSKLAELLAQTPVAWKNNEVKLGAKTWKGESLVPLAIYPNPKQPNHYIVLNSGPTIREKSDPNNSLQTPQLPDWAVVDVSAPATDTAPARIEATGFFDEEWRVE